MKEILRNRKWQLLSLVLATALITSISFNVFYQRINSSEVALKEYEDVMIYTFIVGDFKMDAIVWFENLTLNNVAIDTFNILVKVYTNNYCEGDYLGLVLDMNHNGVIDFGMDDEPLVLWANNKTTMHVSWTLHGRMAIPWGPPTEVFTCTFNPNEGYTFGPYRFATAEVMSNYGSYYYIPIVVRFGQAYQFWIHSTEYPYKKLPPETPTYSVQITSVNATTSDQPVTIKGKIDPPITFKSIDFLIDNIKWSGTLTDKDGKFIARLRSIGIGTHTLYAVLNNYTSNPVQFTLEG